MALSNGFLLQGTSFSSSETSAHLPLSTLFQASFYMLAWHHFPTQVGFRIIQICLDTIHLQYRQRSPSFFLLWQLPNRWMPDSPLPSINRVHDKINTMHSCDQLQVFKKTYGALVFFFHKSKSCSFPWSPTWPLLNIQNYEQFVAMIRFEAFFTVAVNVYHPNWKKHDHAYDGLVGIPHRNWWPKLEHLFS